MTNEKAIEYILKYGKSTDTLKGNQSKSLLYLPYGLVRITIPNLQGQDKHDTVIETIFKHQYGNDWNLDGVTTNEKMSFYLFVKAELERIQQIERTFLGGDPEPELVAAGVTKLNEFGAFATVHSLAGGDILKHEAIEALPYFQVYQTLKLQKVNGDIERRYASIKRQQQTN